jgi:hypothetical protein
MTTTPNPTPTLTEQPRPVLKTWKPTTAGILTLIAGIFNLVIGIGATVFGSMFGTIMSMFSVQIPSDAAGAWPIIMIVGIVILVLGIASIVGGIFAMQRRVWGLGLAGAICALFPPQVIILGILSIIFVAMGKKEFA